MSGAISGVLGDHLPCGNAVRVRLRDVDREALFLELLAGLVGVGSLVVLYGDDEEQQLASTVIFSWVGLSDKPTKEMIRCLKAVISSLEGKGYWDSELFERPFSVVLVNDAFESIDELLFLDDELIKVSLPLLENLDEELNSFINQLLSK